MPIDPGSGSTTRAAEVSGVHVSIAASGSSETLGRTRACGSLLEDRYDGWVSMSAREIEPQRGRVDERMRPMKTAHVVIPTSFAKATPMANPIGLVWPKDERAARPLDLVPATS